MIIRMYSMSYWDFPDQQPLWQEYKAIVWVGDKPGVRVEILATSAEAARDLIAETYGKENYTYMYNVRAAHCPR